MHGRALHARLRGGAGVLQNVVNGNNNIAFLSCFESTGMVFEARAAGMQSSCITIAPCHYMEIFPVESVKLSNS